MHIGNLRRLGAALAVALTAAFAAGSAFADKPEWAGSGKPDKHDRDGRGNDARRVEDGRGRADRDGGRGDDARRDDDRHHRDDRDARREGDREDRYRRADDRRDRAPVVSVHFGDRERTVIREYYVREFSVGHCPPGLKKKGNGCMPPGQAKKWSRGRPLPRDVVYYDLPPAIVIELGPPPAGHRFVRVAADILLIAVGTGMVVDAIEDLGRM